MRRNKAVLRARPRERLIFTEIFALPAARALVSHADNSGRKLRRKLNKTAFRRGAHAINCNVKMLSCDTIKLNAKDLRAACVFESRAEYRAPN
jgi:hypothetical protein